MTQWAVNALERSNDLLTLGHYSPLTITNYLRELRFLFCYYPETRPSQITHEMTLNYLVYLAKTQGCSRVKCKMAAQSFSFFFRHVLNKPYQVPSILFPAHSAKLPAVMSTNEVKTIIDGIESVKHRTLLSLIYSTGMRLREIANLKIADIDSRLMRIRVCSGKGNKDRYTLLSENMLLELRAYYIMYKPEVYLFNGAGKGRKYGERTIQHVIEMAVARAGLKGKNYSTHTFRHSFATHLLDNGTDLITIKELLGHSNLTQTMHYLHLSTRHTSKVVNPLDQLQNNDRSANSKKQKQ